MLNDPLIRYELFKARQRDLWRDVERARQVRAATHDQAGPVKQVEADPDLTGLVERVLQHVWKRLGLPARETVSRPLPAPSGGLPPLLE
jgi:hypothetical protein